MERFLKNKVILFSFAVFILLALIICVFLFTARFFSDSNKEVVVTEDPLIYQSNVSNIQFPIPEGWQINNSIEIDNPLLNTYEQPEVALEKLDSQCVILKTRYKNDINLWPERKQISFAERIWADFAQFDGNWYVASTSENSSYQFSQHDRQYLNGEIRESGWRSREVFVLLNRDGQAVSDECDQDLNNLLESVGPYYEKAYLNNEQEGIIRIDSYNPRVGDGYYYLSFISVPSGERREIMRLPQAGFGEFTLAVVGNTLYLAGGSYNEDESEAGGFYSSALYRLDPFSGESQEISGTKEDGTLINSIFVKNDQIYFLRGDRCFMGGCQTEVYSVPTSGGTPKLVGDNSIGGRILNVSDDGQTFYIERGWGDAGSYSFTFYKVSKDSGEEILANFSGHMGDADYQEKEAAFRAFRASISGREDSGSIYLENGRLILAPDAHDSYSYGGFMFTN